MHPGQRPLEAVRAKHVVSRDLTLGGLELLVAQIAGRSVVVTTADTARRSGTTELTHRVLPLGRVRISIAATNQL